MKKVFFGAGRLGKRAYDICKSFGVVPDYFADNKEELFGKQHCGIKVISVETMSSMEDIEVLITCSYVEKIAAQLQESGVSEEKIWQGNGFWSILLYLCHLPIGELASDRREVEEAMHDDRDKVFFDFSGGLVLGGVESWSLQMGEKLRQRGRKVTCLTNDLGQHGVDAGDLNVIELKYRDKKSGEDMILECLNAIGTHLPWTVICNFPFQTLFAACMAKRRYAHNIHMIAVVHSDDPIYYVNYTGLRDYIDICFVISSQIRQKMIQTGFPAEKIKVLHWEMPVREPFRHYYSGQGELLRIGYAGRLVAEPKRLDLLLQAAHKLDEKRCGFRLEIAGTGVYEHEMKEQIKRMHLQQRVVMLGCLDRGQMEEFWYRQDIMVSCSDLEGHSISQVEAMAAGAVPVITDTSGARDDVQDGYNGYVVGIGQTEEIVDRILFLQEHREILEQMGRRAYETIRNRPCQTDVLEQAIQMF